MQPATRAARAALLLVCAGVGGAWVSPAPDVVVDCETSLAPVVARLADAWGARTHVAVHIYTGPGGRLIGLVRHRARADIVVAEQPVLQTLRAENLLTAAATVPIGADAYVLVTPAAAAVPAGASAAEIAVRYPAVVTDPTAAASFDGQGLLVKLTGGAALATAPRGVASSGAVIAAVQSGTGQGNASLVGLSRMSDAAGRDGLAVAAVVPATVAPPAMIEAALTRNGQSGRAADFLAFIAGPGARPLWQRGGLETPQ